MGWSNRYEVRERSEWGEVKSVGGFGVAHGLQVVKPEIAARHSLGVAQWFRSVGGLKILINIF